MKKQQFEFQFKRHCVYPFIASECGQEVAVCTRPSRETQLKFKSASGNNFFLQNVDKEPALMNDKSAAA